MQIKNEYLEKYLHDIALEQLAGEYAEKGYTITKEEKLGNKYKADLVARKEGSQTIVIEIKANKMSPDKKQQIKDLANYVREQGNYKFIIVFANPPKEKKLEINRIEILLEKEISRDLPSELVQLATNTRVKEVTNVDINKIKIDGASIIVTGDGVVTVEFPTGPDGDQETGDELIIEESFPFKFEITLDHQLKIKDVTKLETDTSSFY